MENEIIINGITYVNQEQKKYKIGDLIEFKGLEWFVTKIEDDGITLMVADKMPENIIEEIFDDDDMRDGDNDIKFDKESNDWKNSYIRKQLNNKFLEILNINKENLLEMTINYSEDEFTTDFVRIPSLKECRNLPLKIVRRETIWSYYLINHWLIRGGWTNVSSGAGVFASYYVYGGGWSGYGFRVVRPVIKIKRGLL